MPVTIELTTASVVPAPYTVIAGRALIVGDTYPVRLELKKLGGVWSPTHRGWLVPLHNAAAAMTLVPMAPPKPTAEVGQLQGLIELFSKAAKHLKKPSIVLKLPSGQSIKLKADYGGGIAIYTEGGYGSFVGKVSDVGQYTGSAKPYVQAYQAETVEMLKALAADPAGVAAAYGKLTSACCFCRIPLTDPRSLGVGYGPICADHYGLPWGAAKTTIACVAA